MTQPGEPVEKRLGALETDMAAVKRQLSEQRKDINDQRRLLEQTLPHLQEGVDQVLGIVLDQKEETRRAMNVALGELRDTLRDQMREALSEQRDEIVALVKSLPTCKAKE
jgi:DNA anti-recombination protein RmuC